VHDIPVAVVAAVGVHSKQTAEFFTHRDKTRSWECMHWSALESQRCTCSLRSSDGPQSDVDSAISYIYSDTLYHDTGV